MAVRVIVLITITIFVGLGLKHINQNIAKLNTTISHAQLTINTKVQPHFEVNISGHKVPVKGV